MKRTVNVPVSILILLIAAGLFIPSQGNAEINVSVTVPLPGLVLSAPPVMVVVPGTYVYYPPEAGLDIFFYQGYWYRPHQGGWYIGNGYNGPWRSIGPRKVPRALISVPPAYRTMPHRHSPMPYTTVRKNWKTWEKEGHWDGKKYERRERGKRAESGRQKGRGRGRHD